MVESLVGFLAVIGGLVECCLAWSYYQHFKQNQESTARFKRLTVANAAGFGVILVGFGIGLIFHAV